LSSPAPIAAESKKRTAAEKIFFIGTIPVEREITLEPLGANSRLLFIVAGN
jgi:hypothetical protein